MYKWTEWPESGNIRLRQRQRKQNIPNYKTLEKAGVIIATAVMIGTSAADSYTTGKLIAFAISAVWVVFYMTKRK